MLLICTQSLFHEGLQRIFQKLEDVELVSLDCMDLQTIDACLKDLHPAMILLAGEKEDDRATHLISHLLKQYEDIPVVWAELEKTVLRLYTSRSLNANSADLVNTIRGHNTHPFEIHLTEKKQGT